MGLRDWGCVVQISPKGDVGEPLNLEAFCGFAKNRSAQLSVTLVCMCVWLFVCLLVRYFVGSWCSQIFVCGFSLLDMLDEFGPQ